VTKQFSYMDIVRYGHIKKVSVCGEQGTFVNDPDQPAIRFDTGLNNSDARAKYVEGYDADAANTRGCHTMAEGEHVDLRHRNSVVDTIAGHFEDESNILDLFVTVWTICVSIYFWSMEAYAASYFSTHPILHSYPSAVQHGAHRYHNAGADNPHLDSMAEGAEVDRFFAGMKILTSSYGLYRTFVGIEVGLIFVQALRHVREYSPRMRVIVDTVVNSRGEVGYFLMVYLLCILMCAYMCYAMGGSTLAQFRSLPTSFVSVLDMLTGGFDRTEMFATHGLTKIGLMTVRHLINNQG
jgi:hypothetical protein